ncbi:MAG: peptide chain release factor 2 [Candidatus Omnitrophota bacterium]|nr:peptide chain release factor 2 [Candidatus Omnitrophota bacterium]
MIEDLKKGLKKVEKRLEQLRVIFDLAKQQKRIKELNIEMARPDFWANPQAANKVILKLKELKSSIEPCEICQVEYEDLRELAGLVKEEDSHFIKELRADLSNLENKLEKIEFELLLSGKYDKANAILSINSGAGGTEACDWVQMLARMYIRWAESKNFNTRTIDFLAGEEAGLKNVTIMVGGKFAYGWLKTEIGVHRLVRISPFDSARRRHTSFASVDVIPEIEQTGPIGINPNDLRIDTFRSSGAGGQHVNVTDSAVRITHLPTGIVVQCQNERSQFKNKSVAMKVLKAKLYEKKLRDQKEKVAQKYKEKMEIAWGSQIRSYILYPYTLIKDHRTGFETSNTQAVMDGGIDRFIEAYLKKLKTKQSSGPVEEG